MIKKLIGAAIIGSVAFYYGARFNESRPRPQKQVLDYTIREVIDYTVEKTEEAIETLDDMVKTYRRGKDGESGI